MEVFDRYPFHRPQIPAVIDFENRRSPKPLGWAMRRRSRAARPLISKSFSIRSLNPRRAYAKPISATLHAHRMGTAFLLRPATACRRNSWLISLQHIFARGEAQ